MLMRLAEIAQATGGRLQGADTECRGVGTDTRKPLAGCLFVALRGPNHDGHDHVAAAAAAGAAAALVDRDGDWPLPVVRVDDTLAALGRLAGAWRARQPARVVAITGNSGKTTTKELTAAVLRCAGPVLATEGNLNNEVGVPLTLFGLQAGHRHAVIEMGQGKPRDIDYLVSFTRPDIALVTNITGAHLAAFASLEHLARSKGEVYSRLGPDGVAIVNLDDAWAPLWLAGMPPCRVLTFSARNAADIRATGISAGDDACARFTLQAGDERATVRLQVPGLHNVSNALAAAAVGHACGIAVADIAAALSQPFAIGGRLDVRMLPGGVRLVDDTYNANPGSVKAAIGTLCGFPPPRVLVLGHMAELGPTAADLHREVGAYARTAGVGRLLALGDMAADTAAGFGEGARAFARVEELVDALRPLLVAGATVLVKGSRSARMERVVAAIGGEENAAVAH